MKLEILAVFLVTYLMCVAGKSADVEDVETFLKHKAEGPAPQEISLIGSLNGKTYYIERTVRTQAAGRAYCKSLGMNLVKFENQIELNFINANIVTSDDFLWTDGELVLNASSFKWATDESNIDPNLLIESGSSVGLTLKRYRSDSRLHPSPASNEGIDERYIICYI